MAANQQMLKLRAAYDTRPPAEKVILGILLAAVIGWLYLIMVSDPVKAEIALMQQQITTSETQMAALQARQQRAEASSQQDPNRAARQRLERLTADESVARSQLDALTGSVISPLSMNRLLTSVLDLHPGLRLTRVENQAPQQLSGRGAAVSAQRVFRHGLLLEFQGDFLSTLGYLVYLESLSENFYWDSLEMVAHEWPSAVIRLQIHTLSMEEGFVGV
ncbi:MAG: hypothetical protein Q8L60_03905 [Gammaproteobacteria bacterium]|nr:hypothetical protein [Gammaproteobacteria bacterium]MDP2139935.1 hypothetical protein [Gammaproteobacteria bacterium]MDP2347755.1 hypothetical protein [Gammaproteobacteria bacterium]